MSATTPTSVEISSLLASKLDQRTARIGVIGLGYVGLPLALLFSEQKFTVTGFDIDPKKIKVITKGGSYIVRIPETEVQAAKARGFAATADYSGISEMDVVIICVPTPLDDHHEPDLSYIAATAQAIAPYLYSDESGSGSFQTHYRVSASSDSLASRGPLGRRSSQYGMSKPMPSPETLAPPSTCHPEPRTLSFAKGEWVRDRLLLLLGTRQNRRADHLYRIFPLSIPTSTNDTCQGMTLAPRRVQASRCVGVQGSQCVRENYNLKQKNVIPNSVMRTRFLQRPNPVSPARAVFAGSPARAGFALAGVLERAGVGTGARDLAVKHAA